MTQDRPLVTFALFTYNQEAYVREAIEGAFAQTYEPLEIILSDDCSTDRTFEIMQEMAAAYEGPHRVRVVQNPENMGATPHIITRGSEAEGEIVVVAAGDDISDPERTTKLVKAHIADGSIYCVTSAFMLVDKQGQILTSKEPIYQAIQNHRSYITNSYYPYVRIQGSTASYRKEVFLSCVPHEFLSFPEDLLFNFMIYAMGRRVHFIYDPLVRYRSHEDAISNKPITPNIDIKNKEILSIDKSKNEIHKMKAFLEISKEYKFNGADFKTINRKLEILMCMNYWYKMNFIEKTVSLIRSTMLFRGDELKWKALRLFGDFPYYQPRTFLDRFQRRCSR